MNVIHYMGLCSVEKAECLAVMTNAQLVEFARKFYGDVPYHQEHRAARYLATIVEALCDELQAALRKIDRLEEPVPCADVNNSDCACTLCEANRELDFRADEQREAELETVDILAVERRQAVEVGA